jgi:hypothetical protein
MPDAKLLLLARELRARAEEFGKSRTMEDAEAQRIMHEMAAGYEKLAQRLEMASEGK